MNNKQADSRMLVYVAGPIRNTTDYVERFGAGCTELYEAGYMAVSPLANGHQDLGSDSDESCYVEYLKRDIRVLMACRGIYLLRGWENSRGARLEKLIAEGLGMVVLFQPDE